MNKKLKEAAENYGWRIKTNTFSDPVKANELANSAKQDFIAGAKYMTERTYSENEVRELLIKCVDIFGDGLLSEKETDKKVVEWFNRYKKK